MKQTILIFLLINILACTNSKDKINLSFTGNELLAVADGGSLNDFTELIKKAKFHITDSSVGRSSGIEFAGYSTGDSLKPPNTLEVNINKNLDVIYLCFQTNNKENFLRIKEDFIGAGFKVSKKSYDIDGLEKERNPIEIIMMGTEKKSKPFRVILGRKK